MTDEEIRKLATQFTEEIFKDDDMSDLKNIDDRHDIWEVCNSFGMFLLEKHCIMPKASLQEIENIICGTFSIGNIAVRQSWEYVKRKLFEEDKK